ncbi:MAG: Gfo/Idh/MocA family oxidoreductase [Bacillota bacterium]|nr:Gfo/Idh/MocA family oxidoreductase [Bacillota bacterium]
MEKQLHVGVIGCGFISAVHLAGYQKCPNVVIKALCDIIPERAEAAKVKYGQAETTVYQDYCEMIARENLDAVSVCTENNLHAAITIDCLNAGLHVLCEKPMAISGEEADRMIAAAKRNNRKLSVGYQLRFTDDAQLLRREVINDRLGNVYYAEATTLRRRGVPTWGVFLNKEKQGGGPLIDTGTHIVDSTLWLMNDYSPIVSAVGATYDHLIEKGGFNNGGHWDIASFEVEDSAFGTVVLASGAMVVIKATWAVNIAEMNVNEVLLCGDKAGASLRNNKLTLNGESNDRLWQYVPESLSPSSLTPYDKEIKAWVDAVVQDEDPVVLPEQAAQVVKVLEALYISARTGKPYHAKQA